MSETRRVPRHEPDEECRCCDAARQELAAAKRERDDCFDSFSLLEEATAASVALLREALEQLLRPHPNRQNRIASHVWTCPRRGGLHSNRPGLPDCPRCVIDRALSATTADAQAWLDAKLAQERERVKAAAAKIAMLTPDGRHVRQDIIDGIEALGSGQHSPAREGTSE